MFFRDGVGEGMYELVEKIEITKIIEALHELYGTNRPHRLTYVIVQKRHHLRTAWRTNIQMNTYDNPPVGTIIRKKIVDKDRPNFYLYSHNALQGTARPAHYQVIMDEMKATNNIEEFARFVFALCHHHQGCAKSISYPTVVYYADKAAGRQSDYFDGNTLHPNLENTTFMV